LKSKDAFRHVWTLGDEGLKTGQPLFGQIDTFSLIDKILQWVCRYGKKKMDVGNCEPNALGQESWQFVLVCGFGDKKMNEIFAENTNINSNQCKICHAFIRKLQAFMQNPLSRSNL